MTDRNNRAGKNDNTGQKPSGHDGFSSEAVIFPVLLFGPLSSILRFGTL